MFLVETYRPLFRGWFLIISMTTNVKRILKELLFLVDQFRFHFHSIYLYLTLFLPAGADFTSHLEDQEDEDLLCHNQSAG